ncbi:MAG: DUF1232 domain-containing protein [Cytophagales bacterium]|jgi:uncharacterized membrane protein YkvA (DUF1232 family)|nr:DUF1232 domain-containing protein [Cytophagales bacterium]
MQNSFFNMALKQAARLMGKPGRVARILAELVVKISRVDWSTEGRPNLKAQISLIGRLIKANLTGTYKLKSTRVLVGLLAACIYFINPFDLVPDLLVGIGLVDDMAIIAWVFSSAATELKAFEEWEKVTSASL